MSAQEQVSKLIKESNDPKINTLIEFNKNIREAIRRVGGAELLKLFHNFFEAEDDNKYHISIQNPEYLHEANRTTIETKKAYLDKLKDIAKNSFTRVLFQKMHAQLDEDLKKIGNAQLDVKKMMAYFERALVDLLKISLAQGTKNTEYIKSAKTQAAKIIEKIIPQLDQSNAKKSLEQIPDLIKENLGTEVESTIVEKVLSELEKVEHESFKTENNPRLNALEKKIDTVVKNFGTTIGNQEITLSVTKDLKTIIMEEKHFSSKEAGLLELVQEVGGKILSTLILEEMRDQAENNLADTLIDFKGFQDLNDFINNHLKSVGTLERFRPSLDPNNPESVKVGILEMFERGIDQAFAASPSKNMLSQVINSVIKNAVIEYWSDEENLDDLDEVVDLIIEKIETLGNEIFLDLYSVTK